MLEVAHQEQSIADLTQGTYETLRLLITTGPDQRPEERPDELTGVIRGLLFDNEVLDRLTLLLGHLFSQLVEPLWLWLWRRGFSPEFSEGVLRPALTPLFVTARGSMMQSAGVTRAYFRR